MFVGNIYKCDKALLHNTSGKAITHQAKLSSISKCEAPNVISVVISFTDPLSVTLQIALEMQTIFMTPDLLAHQVRKVALELLMQRIRHECFLFIYPSAYFILY